MTKLSGMRILYVEDEALIALDMAEALAKEGAIVAGPAGSVADATRLLAEKVDCAVLDVSLSDETIAPH
jgi:DNA-binding response OmpR family regulator